MEVLKFAIACAWLACPPLRLVIEVVRWFVSRNSAGNKPSEYWEAIHTGQHATAQRIEQRQEETLRLLGEISEKLNRKS